MYSLLANFPPEQHKNCLKSARIPAQFLHFSDEKSDGAICTSDLIRASPVWKLWGLSVQKWMSNIKIWQKNPGFSQAEEQNRKAHELITTEQGILLRMNRSIQVESAFGVIKQDFRFKRFLTRGKPKTETQFFLIAFAYNVEKLCNRINSNRFGRSLFEKIIA